MEQTVQLRRGLRRADRVLTGPSLRTRQTADILDLEAVVDPALRECDYGGWAGMPLNSISEKEPEKLMAWMGDLNFSPHGGEALSAVLARAADWLEQNIQVSGHILLITHASFVRACLLHILQAPQSAFWKIDVEPLSITELSTDGRRWTLRHAAKL